MSTNNGTKAGGISVHAVDIARGIPASGLKVSLWRMDGQEINIATGVCSRSGLFEHPVSTGDGVERGLYEVTFDVSDYYLSLIHISEPTRPY